MSPKTNQPTELKSIFAAYMSLPKRTRLCISLGFFAFASVGLFLSDKMEEKFPAKPATYVIPPEELESIIASRREPTSSN
ncbi:hypothetical protein DSO57_1028238 [Entomophthora muscae]|uniref:Uncharacterized protein n=1 Tax=Entomophthora muscae TaxID=34485 RepID=A0ACC2TCK0_9FUNG|nr:hypothetical protein DSO57_1028238 [Entomophthora muscae]